jgi:hypothetical protein
MIGGLQRYCNSARPVAEIKFEGNFINMTRVLFFSGFGGQNPNKVEENPEVRLNDIMIK